MKFALVLTIVSIGNPEKVPDISVPVYYNTVEDCNKQLDFIKEQVNASEVLDSQNNRLLKMENREYHHRNYIYWTCSMTKENIQK